MCCISIIITCYNIEAYIEKCINSIKNQTYKNLQIIIVDDGSTDNTLNKINKVAELDNRITIISKQNNGVQSARIDGLQESRGKYILFVDGDDWLEKNAVEILYKKAKENDAQIVYYNYYYANSNGKKNVCKMPKLKINKEYEFLKETLNTNLQPGLCLKFIKREFINDKNIVFPQNTEFGEDLATTVLIAVNKPIVDYVNEPLYYYFQRENSVTQNITDKVLTISTSLELIYKYLNDYNLYEKFKDEYEFLVYNHIYICRVISQSYKSKFHREFAILWRSKNIKISNNLSYKSYLSNQSFMRKFKLLCYNKNYQLGRTYSVITEFIKNIIKKVFQ
ncbi:glycosyltransferase family 2 protein [Clostridium botulinum]|nr:glycosyltransferase family 2 protein [Clostridium botulinum]